MMLALTLVPILKIFFLLLGLLIKSSREYKSKRRLNGIKN